jgi:poly(A) polymerase Pap1
VNEARRTTILKNLLEMQQKLRDVVESSEMQGRLANDAGAKGFAFAAYMLRESLLVYSGELSHFVEEVLYGDD